MDCLLEGIKVVELGTHIAIPVVSRLMGDWGAEVIKVEPPRGEAWRVVGRTYGIPDDELCNPIFQVPNSGKKDIAINLKSDDGKEAMYKLLGEADIFLTNTRLKGLEKLGLAYEQIKDRFPRLIYAHFSGYGTVGPDKDLPGFDMAAYWARAGMPLEWTTKESGPSRPVPGFGDSTVGSAILAGVLAALYRREKTGQGDFLKSSLFGTALWYNNCGIVQAQYRPKGAYPLSKYDLPTPYHIIYQSKDGDYFFFSVPNWNAIYDKVLTILNLQKYIGDPRFVTLQACRENIHFVADEMAKGFATITTKEAVTGFRALDCVFEVVSDPQEVIADEQAWENDYLTKIKLEDDTEIVIPKPPVQFKNANVAEFKRAPYLGENSREILEELGYSKSHIDALIRDGAIVAR